MTSPGWSAETSITGASICQHRSSEVHNTSAQLWDTSPFSGTLVLLGQLSNLLDACHQRLLCRPALLAIMLRRMTVAGTQKTRNTRNVTQPFKLERL